LGTSSVGRNAPRQGRFDRVLTGLKAKLPQPVRVTLSRAKQRITAAYASALGAGVVLAPVRTRVLLRERMDGTLGLVRPLDYGDGDVLLHIDSRVELNTRLRSCAKEPETIAWIEAYVRAGDVVYDIGANVGAYSLVVDRYTGGAAKVYAFEPGAATFRQLTRNIELNGSSARVIALPIALSDGTGLGMFNYSSTEPGAARHALGMAVDSLGRAFEPAMRQYVLQFSLDEFIGTFSIESPQHVKIDVDGPELEILRGAQRTLRDSALRTVMIEVEPTTEMAAAIVALLENCGFELKMTRSHGAAQETSNYLFVRDGSTGAAS
jgi:FkbM family methyltransferase